MIRAGSSFPRSSERHWGMVLSLPKEWMNASGYLIWKAGTSLSTNFAACPFSTGRPERYRCILPQSLRRYAGLGKEVVFCGMVNRIEIWDKQKYEDAEESPEDLEELAESMEGVTDISF